MKLTLIGATSKTGRPLAARFCDTAGFDLTVVGRDPARLETLDSRARRRVADLDDPATLAPALAGAECVVSLAHARFAEVVLGALPATCRRLVLTGSTRVFTTLPDPAADAVRRAEAAFAAAGQAGVMLHPSMIYGTRDDRSINRILRLLRRWPRALPVVLPLPDGGRHLLQPVFVDDVVDAFVAAVEREDAVGPPIVVAGPEPLSYASMLRCCAAALGRRARIVPVPARALGSVARAATALGLSLPFDAAELERAGENKSFDVLPLRQRLGVVPRPFAEGLRIRLERGGI